MTGTTGVSASAAPARSVSGARDPILMSKIVVPDMPSWLIPRPRLDELIARGTRGPVTTVTGPPGAGKTMALAQWAAGSAGGAVAWVTVDDHDNRPRAFWSYVLAALRQAGVPVPGASPATAAPQAIDHEFLLRFASAMAAQDPPVTLVLDDVHLMTGSKLLAGLAYVLRNAAPGLHLVVASRIDPLLPLHRYRLTGDLTEVRASDLAFTVEESRLLLAQHGITLSQESLEGVTRRAEGWAAVMRMAAMSMDGHSDPDQFAKELVAEDGAVTGYLVAEVLNAQPAHVRDFLLRTSILDRMTEEVASELAGTRCPAVHLADLARANPLVQRDGSGGYRYHSLFASVLRLKLRREHPERVPDLHLRAAAWYRRAGVLTEAVRHAADAGAWQFAARTVIDELAVGSLLHPTADHPLAAGFRHMPQDAGWAEPQPLLVAAAIDFARGRDGASAARLGVADSMLAHCPAEDQIPSRLAASLIRLALSQRTGDFDAAVAAADRAQALIEPIPPGQLACHPEIRARVLSGRGAVELWSGRFEESAAIFWAGACAASSTAGQGDRVDCLGYLALVEVLLGRLNRGAELAAEAVGGAGDGRIRPAAAGSHAAELARALVHLERNELPAVRLRLKRAHDVLRARPDKLIGAVGCMAAARCALAEGRGKKASEIVGRAGRGWSPPAWMQHRLMLLDSRAYTAMADYRSAIDAATRAGARSSAEATTVLARTLLAAGDLQGARRALANVPPGDEAPDSVRLAAWLVHAQLGYASGDHPRGRRSLEEALRLAEPEQLRLPFAMEQSWIRPVLRRDPELGHRYRRLLEPGPVSPGAVSAGSVPAPRPGVAAAAPLVVEPLSGREHEVLRHVSAMESTAEIATEMYISVNTVKTHLKSIYRKLGAGHRSEAVRRARQLGLL